MTMEVASYDELKAECVGASAEFIAQALEFQLSVEDARRRWMRTLAYQFNIATEKIGKLESRIQELQLQAEQAAARYQSDAPSGPTPADRFREAVNQIAATGVSRADAAGRVIIENPNLYRDMLAFGRRGGR